MPELKNNTKKSGAANKAPETKAFNRKEDSTIATAMPVGNPQDVAEAFDEFMVAFEAFRSTNDERLAQMESRVGPDVVTTEKMNRINQALDSQKQLMDHLLLKNKRLGGEYRVGRAGTSTLPAWSIRTPLMVMSDAVRRNGLRRFEEKAMSYGSDPDGGYLVPDETALEIGRRLASISPIRSIANVRTVSSSMYKKPFAVNGPATGWVAETDIRAQTAAPTLSELQFPTMELYAMPAATSTLLDDAAINIDEWLAQEVEIAFAEQESAAFINGDGLNKPKGLLDNPAVDESAWNWGNLGYVAIGRRRGLCAQRCLGCLVDTIYALKAGYRQNANWVMNRRTQADIRKTERCRW